MLFSIGMVLASSRTAFSSFRSPARISSRENACSRLYRFQCSDCTQDAADPGWPIFKARENSQNVFVHPRTRKRVCDIEVMFGGVSFFVALI